MESIRIENLTFSYPKTEKKTLDQISFNIKKGEFVTLCGPSGCGKSTLLRHFKSTLKPHGKRTGEIFFNDVSLESLSNGVQSSSIGFVMQSPENQIVTDKVWHELAFGLESLGMDNQTIRLRVAEMASFLGIQTWFYKNVTELSGGQKQLLNLGSILVMHPSILILDEPTSQLDPIAAIEFLSNVRRINRELGITVLMTEHRLEEVLPYSDRVLVMDDGKLICDNTPEEVGRYLKENNHDMFHSMPVPMRIFSAVDTKLDCPVTVREGRNWIDNFALNNSIDFSHIDNGLNKESKNEAVLKLDEVWFRYEKNGPNIVKGLSLDLNKGELCSILGGNGTGKTTTLSLISGINKPYRGEVIIGGKNIKDIERQELYKKKLAVLPQSPTVLFLKKTVQEDLLDIMSNLKVCKAVKIKRVEYITSICRVNQLLDRHPYDLSGGEQQRVALAKILLLEPEIILMDEPTKGLDAEFKLVFADILKTLLNDGISILMVSHDIEFCAKYSDRCGMFFDGKIVSWKKPRHFFSENSFYTTAANRMARHLNKSIITENDIIEACVGEEIDWKSRSENRLGKESIYETMRMFSPENNTKVKAIEEKPIQEKASRPFKKAGQLLLGLLILMTSFYLISQFSEFTSFLNSGESLISRNSDQIDMFRYIGLVTLFAVEVIMLIRSINDNNSIELVSEQNVNFKNRKLAKRTYAAMMSILVMIPLTIYIGVYYLDDRKYYFISLLIIIETILPFVLVFESKKPKARELIIIAVLCAMGVAGRSAFFMLPQFKPVVAIVIIAGIAFGGETGFLVGAVTGFVSNMFFGQGPWTPWQMFAFGIIGFLAGTLFKKGILRRNKIALTLFGGLSTFFIYGGIMNPASVLIFQNKPTKEMFYLAYLRGIPFDIIHATATVVFLWILSKPMLEKLDRIKIKYGLIESE